MTEGTTGSPYTPHTAATAEAMRLALGVEHDHELFDIPDDLHFPGDLGIEARSERAVRNELQAMLGENEEMTEFLGRGHYEHYVPSLVDHLADRSEFLTSYTQYQPEIAQGFLQALFEYQSLVAALTGLSVANCSMYDGATALGEAARLASRIEGSRDRILVPELLRDGKRAVLENYLAGTEMSIETYPMVDGNVDIEALATRVDHDVALVYVETPTVRGTLEEHVEEVTALSHESGALVCLGSDIVALSVLEEPAAVGVDIVVGEADSLGISTSYGLGLGLFACRGSFLRQVPGRLVGTSTDASGRRAFTLTLQTREQHIRRERATSNICTNQAWVALRTAMHAAWLGPDGLVDLANRCVTDASELADRLDTIDGIQAPLHDRSHFREFVVRSRRPAAAVVDELATRRIAVHEIDEHLIQICTTETTAGARDDLVTAVEEVMA